MAKTRICYPFCYSKVPIILPINIQRPIYHAIGPLKPRPIDEINNETALDWIKHFDKYIASRTKSAYCMLVLNSYKNRFSVEFETYCKDHNIMTLSLPVHSSHITQPLDVGCFRPLKRAYGHEINAFIKTHINYITKIELIDYSYRLY